jgi:flagellin-like protein
MTGMKKGLSPVIATVLLIAVVISLSAIVFFWARGFIPSVIQKSGISASQACSEIVLTATYSSYENPTLLTVTNNGNIPISRFSVAAESNGEIISTDFSDSVLVGNSVSETYSPAEGASITLTPSILGEGGSQKKLYKCENTFDVVIE